MISIPTNTKVDKLNLHEYGYNRFTWFMHTAKANLLLIFTIVMIIAIVAYIEENIRTEQCNVDKTKIGIALAIDFVLIIFTYTCIWPHTQFRPLPSNASKFIGHTAIANQQNLATKHEIIQTPYKSESIVSPTMISI